MKKLLLLLFLLLSNSVIFSQAPTCSSAYPLCSSLDIPFANTTSNPSIGSPGCLGSAPNPTWFYLPISVSGNLNFYISQGNNPPNYNNQDVDFICWGPFAAPQCTGLYDFPDGNTTGANNIVACSYSPSPIETFTIPNAQAGEYYLMMVTNFSNQSGQIVISQSNLGMPGAGAIDCTGLGFVAFLDANANGVKDSNEQNFPLGQFHHEKNDSGIIHHIIAPSGMCQIFDTSSANTYDINFTVEPAYASMYTVSPSSFTNVSVVAGSGGLTNYYFPVTAVQPYNDLGVTIVPVNAPRPGLSYQEKIIFSNLGNQNIAAGTLTFTKDANVTVNPNAGITITATGFTYNFTNLAPFETRVLPVTMHVAIPPAVVGGQILSNTVSIAPLTGDVLAENNTFTSNQVVVNSLDPNDKMEAHGGRILHSTFTSNDYLYYTIRFENSGTASAIDIRINDILDSKLDETSVRMVDASHPYELDRVGNNLNWRFNNVMLPVAVPNSTTGHGYVTFKVKPKAGYAVGDIIPNTAAIYFDFNPPVVTNTFNTQFVSTLGINQFADENFVFYPNPTSGIVTVALQNTDSKISSIKVYDVLGKIIYQSKADNVSSQTIDLSQVTTGMYLIEVVSDTNLKVVKKLMVN